MKRFLSWLTLNHRSLGRQPLFWVAMGLPVILFFIFGCLSWKGSSFQWDSKGFNHFIEISKLPLGLLALAIPFTALVTSMHRSIQTAKQIEEAQVKNTADLYYAHLKFFIERLEGNLLVESPIELHQDLYPHLSCKSYNLDKNNSIAESITTTLKNSTSRMNSHLREAGKSASSFDMLKILSDEISSSDYLTNLHLLKHLHSKNKTEKLLECIEIPENRTLLDKTFSDLNALTALVNM